MKRRDLIYIVCLFLSLSASSQQLHFIRPDKLLNLPAAETYNVMQDSRGYIWFSTEAGLCRYNGNTYEVFGRDKGIAEEACYGVTEDAAGTVWVITSRNRVLRYMPPAGFSEVPFTKTLADSLNRITSLNQMMKSDGDSLLWLASTNYGYCVNTKTNRIRQIIRYKTDTISIFRQGSISSVCRPTHLGKSLLKNKLVRFSIENSKGPFILDFVPEQAHAPTSIVKTCDNIKGDLFISFSNCIIQIKPDMKYEIFYTDNEVLCLYTDPSGGLWAGTKKGGLYYFPESSLKTAQPIRGLQNLSVSGICVDCEQGVWASTLEKGIQYSRNVSVLGYQNHRDLDKKLSMLTCAGNRVFAASEENRFYEIRGGMVQEHTISDKVVSLPRDIIPTSGGWILAFNNNIRKADSLFTRYGLIWSEPGKWTSGASQLIAIDKRLFAMQFSYVSEIVGSKLQEPGNDGRLVIKSALNGGSTGIILACRDGLFEMNTEDFSLQRIVEVNNLVKAITSPDGTIWIITKFQGAYTYRDGALNHLEEMVPFPSVKYHDIVASPDGIIWIASNIGLLKLEPGNPKAQIFNSGFGLPSDEVFKVALYGTNVFVNCIEGLFRFSADKQSTNNTFSPPVYISRLSVNDSLVEGTPDTLLLNYSENNLKITVDALSFKLPTGTAALSYFLKGFHDEPRYSSSKTIVFDKLPPGKYNLEVYALNENGIASAAPARLFLYIDRPFWLKWYFLTTCIIGSAALVYLLIQRKIRRVRKVEEEKTRIQKMISEHHMTALRAQMNPHFIFNCINSIQRSILTHKTEEAYEYLGKFSRLIRQVLDYSEESLITLQQELEIAELYMTLEQQRFENKFEYELNIPAGLDPSTVNVPAMILQPFIENAIWHGMLHLPKDVQGRLLVRAQQNNGNLVLTVEDNGIGREASANLGGKKHRSKAIGINSRRIDALNTINNTPGGDIRIEDVLSPVGTVTGTLVTITIPQSKHHESATS